MSIFLLLLLGLAAGTISGLFGVGGAVIIIPALVFFFKMSQHMAQGTSLALMLPPIGLFAVMMYYKQGHVDLKVAAIICVGFVLGTILGSKYATSLSETNLSRAFGVLLFIISIKMIIGK